ncbi:MAG: enolase C-terminal domain-like protein [Candidatus Bathyarchaeia archaeon]
MKSLRVVYPNPSKESYAMVTPFDIYRRFRRERGRPAEKASAAFVKVETDEGISSIIRAGGPYIGGELQAHIAADYLKGILLGQDPFDVEMLWDQMFKASFGYGRKGAAVMAMSILDSALWDIIGKAKREPVYRLLGGKTRDKIRCYASHLHPVPAKELAAEAQGYVEEGYTAMKMRFIAGPADGIPGMERNLELVKTIRDAVGYNIELMGDVWTSWTLPYAVKMVRKLDRYEMNWVEEPLPADDVEGYVKLRKAVQTPISTGEHEYTLAGFKELIARGAADIVQPDVTWCGGITEIRKVCALAEAYDVMVIPHASAPPSLHLIMSQKPTVCPLAEYLTKYAIHEFEKNPIKPKGGYIELPDRPGLGVEMDEELINRYLVA